MGQVERAPTSIQIQHLSLNYNFYQHPYQSQIKNYEYGIHSRAPTTMRVGPDNPNTPTSVFVPPLRRKMQCEGGVKNTQRKTNPRKTRHGKTRC